MVRCPNCSYILVLLEHRRKYKCAKCGKLFSQKEIDTKEFRNWNVRKRKEDVEKVAWEHKVLKVKRRRKYVDPKEQQKKLQEYRSAYYERHKSQILAYKKAYRQLVKVQAKQAKETYRTKNRESVRSWNRINYWRQQQKKLALQMLEKQAFNPYKPGLDPFTSHFSTFGTTGAPVKLIN